MVAIVLVFFSPDMLWALQDPNVTNVNAKTIAEAFGKILKAPFEGHYRVSAEISPSKYVKASHDSGWVKVSPIGYVIEIMSQESKQLIVSGKNELYTFRLTGNNAEYVLAQLVPLDKAPADLVEAANRQHHSSQSASIPKFFLSFEWMTILESTALTIDHVEQSTWNGHPAVRVRFRVKRSTGDATAGAIAAGWLPEIADCEVVLLTQYGFLPSEWNGRLSLTDDEIVDIKTTVDFDYTQNPPRYIQVVQNRTINGEQDVQTIKRDYLSFRRPRRSEFFVSAFGISEPAVFGRSLDQWWTYLLIIGSVAIAVIIVVLIRRRSLVRKLR